MDSRADDHRNQSDQAEPAQAPLPSALRSTLEEFLGYDGITTVEDWANAIKTTFGNPALTLDDLCFVDATSPHQAVMDGTVHDFACFYDAMILSALTDRQVQIRTASPFGETIRARCDDQTVGVDPPTAICSFGIERDAVPAEPGNPTLEDGYTAMCPYVRAFPTDRAYRFWAVGVPATSIALSVSDGLAFAERLVRSCSATGLQQFVEEVALGALEMFRNRAGIKVQRVSDVRSRYIAGHLIETQVVGRLDDLSLSVSQGVHRI